MKRIILIIFLAIIIFFPYNKVDATTLRDLYNDLNSLESSYNAAQKKANMTQAELQKVKASITTTENEIKQAQNDITKAENEIIASENKIKEKKEETNQMLLYLQLSNSQGNNVLEYVFEAEDYTDFIYRYAVVTQMSEYNQQLMDELNSLVNELTEKKANLAKKQGELSKKKTELQSKYLIVQAQYEDQQDEGLSIADQISEKKKVINHYKKICSMDQDINSCGTAAAVDGWTYPLKSFIQSSIYAEARGSKRHYAVDLAVREGSNVYAVANGTVISAKASTCGGLTIQIRHNYKGSDYVSLYMHLIDGYVSIGDTVTRGQVIGTSGGGPLEIAKWGDYCTEGAHLHFAMATGSYAIGYSSQQGTTFNPIKFFPAMKGYGASL